MFHLKSFSKPKKAQVTVYIFAVMATLVLTAFIVIEVGKTAKDKTYSDNAADAGALATASVMATGFNYLSDKNGKNGQDKNKTESDKELGDGGDGQGEIPNDMKKAIDDVEKEIEQEAQAAVNAGTCPPSSTHAANAAQKAATQMTNLTELWNDLTPYNEKQRLDMKNQADNLYGESGNQKNYYDTAISQGYKIAFQNSGVSHRLGRLGQKMYGQFLQSLEPGSVHSGEPKTFFWVDGSGRAHMVTVIIQAEPVKNWTVVTAKDDTHVTGEKLQRAFDKYKDAMMRFNDAVGIYSGCPSFCPCVIFCLGKLCWRKGDGDTLVGQGETAAREGYNIALDAIQGLNQNDNKERSQSSDLNDETPKYIEDVHHSRTVHAICFQFHMGSPIKSVYGDIDTMTFYPPVQSSAVATFNYTGGGDIHSGRQGSDPKHESGLIAAF